VVDLATVSEDARLATIDEEPEERAAEKDRLFLRGSV
jgi:hypothetical protein